MQRNQIVTGPTSAIQTNRWVNNGKETAIL